MRYGHQLGWASWPRLLLLLGKSFISLPSVLYICETVPWIKGTGCVWFLVAGRFCMMLLRLRSDAGSAASTTPFPQHLSNVLEPWQEDSGPLWADDAKIGPFWLLAANMLFSSLLHMVTRRSWPQAKYRRFPLTKYKCLPSSNIILAASHPHLHPQTIWTLSLHPLQPGPAQSLFLTCLPLSRWPP